MGPKIKMSSLEDSDNDIQQFNEAVEAFKGAAVDDIGSYELTDSKGLRKLIQSNKA